MIRRYHENVGQMSGEKPFSNDVWTDKAIAYTERCRFEEISELEIFRRIDYFEMTQMSHLIVYPQIRVQISRL